jgi:predicted  nucleic acid-binding Zn-ribbon protein
MPGNMIRNSHEGIGMSERKFKKAAAKHLKATGPLAELQTLIDEENRVIRGAGEEIKAISDRMNNMVEAKTHTADPDTFKNLHNQRKYFRALENDAEKRVSKLLKKLPKLQKKAGIAGEASMDAFTKKTYAEFRKQDRLDEKEARKMIGENHIACAKGPLDKFKRQVKVAISVGIFPATSRLASMFGSKNAYDQDRRSGMSM